VIDRSTAPGTRRAVEAIAVVALVLGIALGSRLVLAFGAAWGGVLIAMWLYPRLGASALRLRRTMPSRAVEDDDVAVAFALENAGPLPLAWVTIEDHFTPDRGAPRRVLAGPLLAPGARRGLRYDGNCYGRRGAYEIGPARAHLHDPLGLFPVRVQVLGTSPLLVLPSLEPLPWLPAGGGGLPLAGGPRLARTAGASPIALTVREYRAGDALRSVHWPTTARRGKLMIVEHEHDGSGEVMIALDLSRASLRGLGRRSTLETSVRIAAGAAAHYLRRGERVSLFGRGRDDFRVPPGVGELQLARVLESLARVRPDGDVPFDVALREHAPEVSPGSTVVAVIADLQIGVDRAIAAVAHLRARGASIVAVLLDDASFLKIFDEQARRPQETVRLTAAADALLADGATVYTVAQGDDLSESFARPYAGPTRLVIDLEALVEVEDA
jgi:uncharacterized protein (DUF58 family)